MSVGPVNNGQGFAHEGNLPGNEGEPQAPRGDGPRNDRANGNGNNGNGNGGVHGNEGNGPRTGGNNPASVEGGNQGNQRSEEHTSELQSLMRISYAVFCLKKKKKKKRTQKAKIVQETIHTH